jgi:5-methylcytosine-specific restriction endonuclease McrA
MELITEGDFIKAGKEWLENDRLRKLDRHRKNNEEFYDSNPNYMRKYREEHSVGINKSKKKYKRTEKGKANNQRYKAKRRSREKSSPNTLTFSEWLAILRKYNYKCAYCGVAFSDKNLPERDHVIPVSKGGDNTKGNIVPSCRLCNAKKGGRIL